MSHAHPFLRLLAYRRLRDQAPSLVTQDATSKTPKVSAAPVLPPTFSPTTLGLPTFTRYQHGDSSTAIMVLLYLVATAVVSITTLMFGATYQEQINFNVQKFKTISAEVLCATILPSSHGLCETHDHPTVLQHPDRFGITNFAAPCVDNVLVGHWADTIVTSIDNTSSLYFAPDASYFCAGNETNSQHYQSRPVTDIVSLVSTQQEDILQHDPLTSALPESNPALSTHLVIPGHVVRGLAFYGIIALLAGFIAYLLWDRRQCKSVCAGFVEKCQTLEASIKQGDAGEVPGLLVIINDWQMRFSELEDRLAAKIAEATSLEDRALCLSQKLGHQVLKCCSNIVKCSILTRRVSALENELRQVQDDDSSLAGKLKHANQRLNQDKLDIEALTDNLKKVKSQSQNNAHQAAENKKEIENQKNKNRQLATEASEDKKEIERQASELQDLTGQLSAKDGEIDSQKSLVKSAETDVSSIRKELQSSKSENGILVSNTNLIDKKLEEQTNNNELLSEQVFSLEKESKQHKSRIEALTQDVSDKDDELCSLLSATDDIVHEAVQKVIVEKDALAQDLAARETELKQQKLKEDGLNEQLSIKKQELDAKNVEKLGLVQGLSEKQVALDEQTSLVESLNGEVSGLKKELQEEKTRYGKGLDEGKKQYDAALERQRTQYHTQLSQQSTAHTADMEKQKKLVEEAKKINEAAKQELKQELAETQRAEIEDLTASYDRIARSEADKHRLQLEEIKKETKLEYQRKTQQQSSETDQVQSEPASKLIAGNVDVVQVDNTSDSRGSNVSDGANEVVVQESKPSEEAARELPPASSIPTVGDLIASTSASHDIANKDGDGDTISKSQLEKKETPEKKHKKEWTEEEISEWEQRTGKPFSRNHGARNHRGGKRGPNYKKLSDEADTGSTTEATPPEATADSSETGYLSSASTSKSPPSTSAPIQSSNQSSPSAGSRMDAHQTETAVVPRGRQPPSQQQQIVNTPAETPLGQDLEPNSGYVGADGCTYYGPIHPLHDPLRAQAQASRLPVICSPYDSSHQQQGLLQPVSSTGIAAAVGQQAPPNAPTGPRVFRLRDEAQREKRSRETTTPQQQSQPLRKFESPRGEGRNLATLDRNNTKNTCGAAQNWRQKKYDRGDWQGEWNPPNNQANGGPPTPPVAESQVRTNSAAPTHAVNAASTQASPSLDSQTQLMQSMFATSASQQESRKPAIGLTESKQVSPSAPQAKEVQKEDIKPAARLTDSIHAKPTLQQAYQERKDSKPKESLFGSRYASPSAQKVKEEKSKPQPGLEDSRWSTKK